MDWKRVKEQTSPYQISLTLLAMSVGIVTHRFIGVYLDHRFLLIAGMGFLLIVIFKNPPGNRANRLKRWIYLLLWIGVGWCWANFVAGWVLNQQLPSELEKKDVVAVGEIIGVPITYSRYTRFDFEIRDLTIDGRRYVSPGKVRLKSYDLAIDLKSGQVWSFTVRMKRPHSYQNPGNPFNYEQYLFTKRIRGTGYVRNQPEPVLLSQGELSIIDQFREQVFDFVEKVFSHAPHSGILTALLVGLRGSMHDDQWEVLQKTGTIHLVAISGLHIGLVFGLVVSICTWLWRFTGQWQCRLTAPRFGVVMGLLAAISYALLAGMTIPTQRALAMVCVLVIAMIGYRRPSVLESMAMVLSVILIVDPLAPLSNGFWLSFCAVFAIGLCLYQQGSSGKSLSKFTEVPIKWVRIQLGIFVGMLPVLFVLFHQVSLVAPMANLLAVPVVGMVIVPLALIGLAFFALEWVTLATLIFQWTLALLDMFWPILVWLSEWQYATWSFHGAAHLQVMLAFIGIGIMVLPQGLLPRWLGGIWCLPLFFVRAPGPGHGEFHYTLLEVGQGLASVVITQNHVLVFDTGPGYEGGYNAGRSVVNPFLKHQGIEVVDKLVVSHRHNDHMGGYEGIKSTLAVKETLAGMPQFIAGSKACRRGMDWSWDGVRFDVLWPVAHSTKQWEKNPNNASCVIQVYSSYGRLLLTGDIEKQVERRLVDDYRERLQSDVLQVPHQGSKTSSTTPFLDAVNPDVALVSTGYKNRFGHPHESVLKRYDSMGIDVMNTAHRGALIAEFSSDNTIYGYRDQLRGYWLSRWH